MAKTVVTSINGTVVDEGTVDAYDELSDFDSSQYLAGLDGSEDDVSDSVIKEAVRQANIEDYSPDSIDDNQKFAIGLDDLSSLKLWYKIAGERKLLDRAREFLVAAIHRGSQYYDGAYSRFEQQIREPVTADECMEFNGALIVNANRHLYGVMGGVDPSDFAGSLREMKDMRSVRYTFPLGDTENIPDSKMPEATMRIVKKLMEDQDSAVRFGLGWQSLYGLPPEMVDVYTRHYEENGEIPHFSTEWGTLYVQDSDDPMDWHVAGYGPFTPFFDDPEKYLDTMSFSVGDVRADKEWAIDTFVRANLRLVIAMSSKLFRSNVDLTRLDLIQEGNIGLLKGIELFDPFRGYKASTYISHWIRQTIKRAMADKGRTIRIPVHLTELYYRMIAVKREMTKVDSEEPADEDLVIEARYPPLEESDVDVLRSAESTSSVPTDVAARLKQAVKSYRGLVEMFQDTISGDDTVGDDEDGATLFELIASDKTPESDVEYNIDKYELRMAVRKVLAEIKEERVRSILVMRFGLDFALIPQAGISDAAKIVTGGVSRQMTLDEIAPLYDLTRERIRQLEVKGLELLSSQTTLAYLRSFTNKKK